MIIILFLKISNDYFVVYTKNWMKWFWPPLLQMYKIENWWCLLFSPFISCAIFSKKNFIPPKKCNFFTTFPPNFSVANYEPKCDNLLSSFQKTMIWNVKFKFFLLLAKNFTLRIIKKNNWRHQNTTKKWKKISVPQ